MRELIARRAMMLFVASIIGWMISNIVIDTNAMKETTRTTRKSGIESAWAESKPAAAAAADANALLAGWEGPYGGVPPFDRVQIALFKPALEAAMALCTVFGRRR